MASMNFEPIHFTNLKDNIYDKSPLLGAIFLFLLFFFTFLFVYFLYICTHHRHVDSDPNPTTPPGLAGLDPATISGLPVFSYGSSHKAKPSPEAECAICLSLFQEGEKVKVLPLCRHGFHADCVDMWLQTGSSCPLCRASINRVDELGREVELELP